MARKFYRAPSKITVSVYVSGRKKTISFFPLTNGSQYTTEDINEQNALEGNAWFGDKYFIERVDNEEKKEEVKEEVKPIVDEEKKITVSSISDALDYLIKEFNASEKQLTGKRKIKAFAKEKNIEFVGL
jgi:hypothetical protein